MNTVTDQAAWMLARGTGVVALSVFTLALVLGVVARSGRPLAGLGRFGVNELHRTAALTGTTLVAVHVGTLMIDPYAQLRWFDAVVPFAGQFKPLWQGLGTLAVDLLVVITVVSLLRHRLGPRVFRAVHWATYGLWPVAALHALGNGTDAGATWLRVLVGVCTVSVVASVGWRLSGHHRERGRKRTPRTLPRRQGVPA
ncbi:ferric reductase-like transmembrane domain-containing protein [Spongisporangium articulatum]|uniref:Ferric reductase-like transmembrane domain-containing protein n=1 Tax=Spongisporangium articulatum TaxID=3362603 RepID=A0ABW8AS87_9ACTN